MAAGSADTPFCRAGAGRTRQRLLTSAWLGTRMNRPMDDLTTGEMACRNPCYLLSLTVVTTHLDDDVYVRLNGFQAASSKTPKTIAICYVPARKRLTT